MHVEAVRRARAGVLFFALALAGCASSPPHAKFADSAKASSVVLHANDTVALGVSAGSGVTMAEYEVKRLGDQIKTKLAAKQALNPASGEPKRYEINLTVTRYEKGNAFARAMLAGLGQIHLDGLIKVFEEASRTPLSEFSLDKTFAWGGIYGSATSMEDIEGTFAEGVANALTGREKETKAGPAAAGSAASAK